MARGYYSDAFKIQLTPPTENAGTQLGKMFLQLGALAENNYQAGIKERQLAEENRRKNEALSLQNALTQANIEHMKQQDDLAAKKSDRENSVYELQAALTGNRLADTGAVAAVTDYDTFDEWKKHYTLNDPTLLTAVKSYYDTNRQQLAEQNGERILSGLVQATNGGILSVSREQFAKEYLPALIQNGSLKNEDIMDVYRVLDENVFKKKDASYAPTKEWKNFTMSQENPEFAKYLEEGQLSKSLGVGGRDVMAAEQRTKSFMKKFNVDYDLLTDGDLSQFIGDDKKKKESLENMIHFREATLKDRIPDWTRKKLSDISRLAYQAKTAAKLMNQKDTGPLDAAWNDLNKFMGIGEDFPDRMRAQGVYNDFRNMLIKVMSGAQVTGNEEKRLNKGLPTLYQADKAVYAKYLNHLEALSAELNTLKESYDKVVFNYRYGNILRQVDKAVDIMRSAVYDKGKTQNMSDEAAWNAAQQNSEVANNAAPAPAVDMNDILQTATGPNGEKLYKSRRDGKWYPMQ